MVGLGELSLAHPTLARVLGLMGFVLCSSRLSGADGQPRGGKDGGTMAFGEERCVVGAIRWDAWHGDKGVPGKAVEQSLGPSHWHYRLPFFGKVVSDGKVEARGDSQAVMDQEIAYAHQARLDYWAFVTYAPESPMSRGLDLYLSSTHKTDIRFCLILQGGHVVLNGPASWPGQVARYVGYFREKTYQTVAGGRPLVYLLEAQALVGRSGFASWEAARAAFGDLRKTAVAAGLREPYLVVQDGSAPRARNHMESLGFDAISAYATIGGGEGKQPYSKLAEQCRGFWDDCRATGSAVVPIIMAGWDRRPRQEHPVPWERGEWTQSTLHYAAPTPAELASLLSDALKWVREYPQVAPAMAVLIYAWNELDEGGWIVPTLSEGAARLDALKAVLAAGR